MTHDARRVFELRYSDPKGLAYFYVTLADAKQRARVARKVGMKRGEMLLSLRHFWIARKCRGAGAGKQLIKRLAAALDALGLPVALYAHPYDDNPMSREALVKFYEKAGFRQIGVAKGDEWDGDPVMVRGVV